MQDIPVLIIVFNRAWNACKVAEALQKIRPAQLFLAGDGPRRERPGEEALCLEARKAVLDAVNWPCQVHTHFQENNLGCGRHMTAAISWFFEHVESGIILEDDCVPSEDFFRFSADLLERYRNDTKVMMLSGTALVRTEEPSPYDYDFTYFPCCWGWATWRRAWQLMDYDMPDFPAYRRSGVIRELFPAGHHQRRLLELFSKVYHHAPGFDTWDFQWLYACVKHKGLCILPARNLVSNVGWDASHARIDDVMEMPFEKLEFPLKHPAAVQRNIELENIFFDRIYAKAPLWKRALDKLKKLLFREKR